MNHACHWIIDPPDGPTSMGKCKACGKEREFRNGLETWTTDDWGTRIAFGRLPITPRELFFVERGR